jgi:GTPase Era involved in 16S rRNA processing
VRRFYVYLAGACNVGKSTLASILIVEEILHIAIGILARVDLPTLQAPAK